MNKYTDLLIENGSIKIDNAQPATTHTRHAIGQDVKHMLLESGLLSKLIGQRSEILRQDVFIEMELIIEKDNRLVPGTIEIVQSKPELIIVTADTVEFGKLENVEVNLAP
ncbi:MAG: DUF2590 family protein [Parashewanella sp.]